MKEHPIIFSTPMVQAILDGRKTQTRRILKAEAGTYGKLIYKGKEKTMNSLLNHCPYGQSGDLLWVRETFAIQGHTTKSYIYRSQVCSKWDLPDGCKWKPSIHMPKAAARIWLQIKSVRIEQLQDISDHDAIAEGVELVGTDTYKNYSSGTTLDLSITDQKSDSFYSPSNSLYSLWIKIHGKESLLENPWVWAVEFEVVSTTGKPVANTRKTA